jgi:hypothetical protein
MAYPPTVPSTTRTNATPQVDNHPGDHNALATALSDIVNELGPNPSGPAATIDARLLPLAGAINSGAASIDNVTPPTPFTGIMVSAGSTVGIINGAFAFDIPLSFPNSLISIVGLNGDSTSNYWIQSYSPNAQQKSKAVVRPVQADGNLMAPGNMIRVNWIAVGW